jgi:hypothetical protein
MKLLLQFLISLFIGSFCSDLVEISYNGLSHYFEIDECSVDIIADCFNLDPESEITLDCDCGSTLYPNEDGLFEGVSSDNTYECNGIEDEELCPCIEAEIISPELLNGWYENYPQWPVRATKTGNTVHLMGVVGHLSKPLTTVFILPEGWRPYQNVIFDQFLKDGWLRFEVSTAGEVFASFRWGVSSTHFLLDKVSFIAFN